MAEVTLKGLTEEEAEEFAKWYCSQGEQNANTWFDINVGHPAPEVDIWRDAGYYDVDEDGDVTVFLKSRAKD